MVEPKAEIGEREHFLDYEMGYELGGLIRCSEAVLVQQPIFDRPIVFRRVLRGSMGEVGLGELVRAHPKPPPSRARGPEGVIEVTRDACKVELTRER